MIEMSTLTGACLVALGENTAGLFTNDSILEKQLLESAKNTNENIWSLPINEEHREAIKSKNADIKNIGNRYAGSSTAASFLERFVEEGVAWAHIDIAGYFYRYILVLQWLRSMTLLNLLEVNQYQIIFIINKNKYDLTYYINYFIIISQNQQSSNESRKYLSISLSLFIDTASKLS